MKYWAASNDIPDGQAHTGWVLNLIAYDTTHWSFDQLRWFSLTHLPLDKMATISQTIFSDAFFVNEKFYILIKISLKLFQSVQLTITQVWFR